MELVADGGGDETGVHHLQHVLVLQILGDWDQLYRFLALLDQPAVERLEVLPVARRTADVDRLSRQLVQARDPPRPDGPVTTSSLTSSSTGTVKSTTPGCAPE